MRPARSLGRPEPPPENESLRQGTAGGEGIGESFVRTGTSSHGKSVQASARERHDAFWARMDRCKTIEALEREFLREAHLKYGAPSSTVEALMLSLRERGVAALTEADTRRRFADLSTAQVREVLARLIRARAKFPAITDDLLLIIGEQM